jgi:class 3 adenylate cyclase
VGLSSRDAAKYTQDVMVGDLEAIADSAHLERFDLFASSFSVPWAIEYAARHPDRVRRLVLTSGFIRSVDVSTRENLEGILGVVRSNWDLATRILADMGLRESSSEMGLRYARQYQQNTNAESVARRLLDGYDSTDVGHLLHKIDAPTLVIHRIGETFFKFSAAQEMAALIPGAHLVALPNSGPISAGDDAAANVQAVIDFLDSGKDAPAKVDTEPAGAFRTVLFTDLVGHTEMMRRLGDDRGREVLREHERITRELLKQHGGAEVKTMGDGFMASFASVTKAMDCAIALQRAFAAHEGEPLLVRVGLNAGEPIEEDGDLFGSTVILASRVAAKAGAGEILIPEPLRHLLTGKSYVYADRGETMLKGFEDAVRLYEVRWTE